MEILNQHVTIRKFKNQPVPDELINSVLYSGTKASTTGNMQLYSIIITQRNDVEKELLPLHFNQEVAKSAPVLLTFVADLNRFVKWCEVSNANSGYDNFLFFLTAAIDAVLVAQNVCIAAENLGLGICYLGTTVYNSREIIKVLDLPKLTFPVTSVAIGYPDEYPAQTDRLPLRGIIHHDKYRNYTEQDIADLYSFKENLESSKQFIKQNNKEKLAQVYTDVRYKKQDNELFSEKMLGVLKEQGFYG